MVATVASITSALTIGMVPLSDNANRAQFYFSKVGQIDYFYFANWCDSVLMRMSLGSITATAVPPTTATAISTLGLFPFNANIARSYIGGNGHVYDGYFCIMPYFVKMRITVGVIVVMEEKSIVTNSITDWFPFTFKARRLS